MVPVQPCCFQWKIENISQYVFNPGGQLKSPTFVFRTPTLTKWSLELRSIFYSPANRFYVSIQRELTENEADVIEVNYHLEILVKNSSVFTEKIEQQCKFSKNVARGFEFCMKQEELSDVEREFFFPDDILTVQCTLWIIGLRPVFLEKNYGRTVLKVCRRSFTWRIPKFSTRTTPLTDMFRDVLIQFDISLNVGLNLERRIIINFFDENLKRFSLKTSFIDCNGEKEDCDTHDYYRSDLDYGILSLSPTLLTQTVMFNKNRFLHDDILTLECECIFLTTHNLIEFFKCTGISKKLMNQCVENKSTDDVLKLLGISVINDFQAMYNEAILSDISLRTSTKTFPAHKNILSARSPVFRRMFSHDMKEKNSGLVDIIDFHDNTIHQMLLYMYTDKLEDLDLERASQLYVAADKYEINSLKSKCSSFLKENVCPTNACEVLVLADLHNDDDLKIFIQDFILGNHKEVFCLQEWKLFMDTHPKLASVVMYRKFNQE